jgi:hypothetical protein
MPTVTFLDKGGYKLTAGDVLKTSATYDNPTGKVLHDAAMGIVVGYFVSDDDTQMASLRRKPKRASRQTAAITHDLKR